MNSPDHQTQASSSEVALEPSFCEGPIVRVLRLRQLLPFFVFINSIICSVSARPVQGQQQIQRRDNSPNGGTGTINSAIWVPILVVTLVFAAFSLVACVRRSMSRDIASLNASAANPTSTPATTISTTRRRRRPRRTPSQISTKSLPPYMKEPGDHELVIYGGPQDSEDDHEPHGGIIMPTVAEGDEPSDLQGTTFSLSLDRVDSHETSTTNLIRDDQMSEDQTNSVRQSMDARSTTSSVQSYETNAGLLSNHERTPSEHQGPDPRGEAPPYFEAISGDITMTTVSLNDPDTHPGIPPALSIPVGIANAPMLERSTQQRGNNRRSRFSFLHNPFSTNSSSTNRSPHVPTSITNRAISPSLHARTGSAVSVVSTDSSPDRRPTHQSSRSGSGSGFSILRSLRSHSPHNPHSGPMSSPSTISVDSISAPLPHTLTRSEFRVPKGGLTEDQIKLITSRDALESRRFGVPYGADAVAAFSASRLNMDAPPPDFDSWVGAGDGQIETQQQTQTDEPSETPAVGNTTTSADVEGAVAATILQSPERPRLSTPHSNTESSQGAGSSPSSSSTSGRSSSERSSPIPSSPQVESRSSTVLSFATAVDPIVTSGHASEHMNYALDSETDDLATPVTARPITPLTAVPMMPVTAKLVDGMSLSKGT